MKKIRFGDVIFSIFTVLFVIAFGLISQQNVRLKQERQELKDEIQELNREIGEYQAMNSFWEDYIDLLGEIYQGKINEAVLEERLKNQPSNEKNIEQILDDFELLIELQQYYYQENITSHIFGDWLQINYPALYERILNYY